MSRGAQNEEQHEKKLQYTLKRILQFLSQMKMRK